jgi:lycopene cyclase domain-containing protein
MFWNALGAHEVFQEIQKPACIMKYTYLLVDFFTVIIPFLFSFHPKTRFTKKWKSFFPAMLILALVFVGWDIAFERMGVWSFNPRYLTGIEIAGLPIEEILFFVCIPYACVFTFYCFDKFFNLTWKGKAENYFVAGLCFLLFTFGLVYFDRLYTSVTFISTAIVLLMIKLIFREGWLGKAIKVYALLLIPFFIVNGILTGTGPEEPVVLYNDLENLGIRILTIPIEDAVYGFELFLLNVWLFKLFGGLEDRDGNFENQKRQHFKSGQHSARFEKPVV